MFGKDDEDRPSVLEQIKGSLGNDDSGQTRVQGEPCMGCNATEGSMVHDREAGWTLCRDCFNDPEVLSEYAD